MVVIIQRIQKRVAQIITGAFSIIVGAVVNVEIYLFLVIQQLEQIALEVIIYIRASSLYTNIAVSGSKGCGNLKSLLNRLLNILACKYDLQLDCFESVLYIVLLQQILLIVYIIVLVDKVIKEYNIIEIETICIYIDGSGINDYVRAVTVALNLYINDIIIKQIQYIGILVISIVYAVEFNSLVIVLKLLLKVYIAMIIF